MTPGPRAPSPGTLAPAAPRRSAAWLVALLCATATASYLCRVNVSVVGVLVMREFSLTQAEMGRVFSAFLVTYAIFQLPAGMLADRWGARRVLAAAAWCWVAATAIQAVAGSPLGGSAAWSALSMLVAGRLLLGVAEAPTFTAAAQGISTWTRPAVHARANGIVIAAVGLGSALAPPLLTWAMLRVGWRGALLASAVPAALAAIAWHLVTAPAIPSPARGRPSLGTPALAVSAGGEDAVPRARRRRQLALLTLSYTLQGYVGYIFVFWFYLYLVQERHFDLLRGALLGSLPWILTIVSVPLGGAVADRLLRARARTAGTHASPWRRRAVPMTGLVGAGVFIAIGAHTVDPWVAAAALAGATALVMCVEGPFWATMTRLSGGRTGFAGGLMNTGCNIGGLVSPALTPLLAASLGWERALQLAAVLSAVGGLLWLGIGAIDEPPSAT